MNKVSERLLSSPLLAAVPASPAPSTPPNIKYGVPSERGVLLAAKATPWPNPANKTPDWQPNATKEGRGRRGRSKFPSRPGFAPGNGRNSRITRSGSTAATWPPPTCAGTNRLSQSFYLSNMAPQVGVGMNRDWKDLKEDAGLGSQENSSSSPG